MSAITQLIEIYNERIEMYQLITKKLMLGLKLTDFERAFIKKEGFL